jgi:regulator of protease activity HflC (stomatin/prohibitin superfamily)
MGSFLALGFLSLAAVIISKGFVIIRQSHVAVVERMGKFSQVLNPGWHILIPVVDNIVQRFDMRETLHDFEPTSVITRDNATVRINAVTYYRITDPQSAAYNVQNFRQAMEQLIITTLRNLIGEMELDESLNGRNTINSRLQAILDEATEIWGLKVSRVEIKEITPMGEVAEAMDRQMVAERKRRAQILEAEGSKTAAILQAEGAKQSAILRAEGEREVLLLNTNAQAEATRINAEAQKQAIETVKSGFTESPEQKYMQLKYLETLPKMAQGEGSTIYLPTELSSLASLGAFIKQ